MQDLCKGQGEWFCDPGLCEMCDFASGRNRDRVSEIRFKISIAKRELEKLEAELAKAELKQC